MEALSCPGMGEKYESGLVPFVFNSVLSFYVILQYDKTNLFFYTNLRGVTEKSMLELKTSQTKSQTPVL